MEVTCPEGVEPGDTVSFTTHDGREMTATVPDGVASGETFTVAVDDDDACTSPAKPEEGACRQPTRALVYDLVEHAQRLLEIDMAPVLEARCHLFDQDVEELTSGQGETFEQYAAFQEFEGLLEAHCERFVAERGFASAAECFAAIDRTVAEDAARQQREMAVLHERLRAVQREVMKAQAHGGADGADGTKGDDHDSKVHAPPMVMGALPGGGIVIPIFSTHANRDYEDGREEEKDEKKEEEEKEEEGGPDRRGAVLPPTRQRRPRKR